MTGAIDRMGKAADGNTVCDYDPEEIKRQISISTSVALWSTRAVRSTFWTPPVPLTLPAT